MEPSRFLAYSVVVTSVLVGVYGISSYTRYESTELGHVRLHNGTLEWGAFPLRKYRAGSGGGGGGGG